MAILNAQQLRIVDPLLTNVVQGYENQEYVGKTLFPHVPVKSRSGRVLQWGKHNFVNYRTKRAPGAATNRRTLGYSSGNYELCQDSIEVELTREEIEEFEAANIPFNLQREAAEAAMETLMLNLEVEQASVATDPANYGVNNTIALAAADQLDNPASSIITRFNLAGEQIRRSTGKRPNVAVFSPQAVLAAMDHPEIRAYLAPTSSSKATLEMIARVLGLKKIVEGASVIIDPTDPTGAFADAWDNCIVLACVPDVVRSRKHLSYGYTYTLEGYPIAEEPYADRNHKSFYFPATCERSPVITSMESGFLMTNVTSTYP